MSRKLRAKILEKHGGDAVGTCGAPNDGWKYVARIYDDKMQPLFGMQAFGETEKKALENLLAMPKRQGSIHPRYASAWSSHFWECVDSIENEALRSEIYNLGVDLQNLEAKVLRKLVDATSLCLLDSYSSVVCSKGTKCCVAKHGEKS